MTAFRIQVDGTVIYERAAVTLVLGDRPYTC
jgi:hypothetical protein